MTHSKGFLLQDSNNLFTKHQTDLLTEEQQTILRNKGIKIEKIQSGKIFYSI